MCVVCGGGDVSAYVRAHVTCMCACMRAYAHVQ